MTKMLSECVLLVIVLTRFTAARIQSNIEFSADERSQYVKSESTLSSDSENFDNQYYVENNQEVDVGPLYPDYPTLTEIPKTTFSCYGKVNWRYYADPDANCQVFHICQSDYSKVSFLCPVGSTFNQKYLICDWWYNVNCNDAVDLYEYMLIGSQITEQLDESTGTEVEGQQQERQQQQQGR